MQEKIIKFKTAKLAKEKGFDIETINYYTPKGHCTESEGYRTERLEFSNWNNGQGNYPTLSKEVECSAPSQSLLQRWLREVHNIHINIFTCKSNGYGLNRAFYYVVTKEVNDIHSKEISNKIDTTKYLFQDWINKKANKSYEEALELGLFEALKLISIVESNKE